jgi:hypothetical protein
MSPIEMVQGGSRVAHVDCMLQSLYCVDCRCWEGLFLVGWWHIADRKRRCRRCRGRRPLSGAVGQCKMIGDGGRCVDY